MSLTIVIIFTLELGYCAAHRYFSVNAERPTVIEICESANIFRRGGLYPLKCNFSIFGRNAYYKVCVCVCAMSTFNFHVSYKFRLFIIFYLDAPQARNVVK